MAAKKKKRAKRSATKRNTAKKKRAPARRKKVTAAGLRMAWERAHARELRMVAKLPPKATRAQLEAARGAADATNKARRKYMATR